MKDTFLELGSVPDFLFGKVWENLVGNNFSTMPFSNPEK